MQRAVFALFASSALVASAAQAQAQAQAQAYAAPGYPPAPAYAPAQAYAQPCCAQPAYPPQYAQPQYAPPPRADGLRGYAEPQYPNRPRGQALRGYVGVEYGKARLNPGTPSPRVETWTGEAAVAGQTRGFGVQGDLKVASFNGPNDDGTVISPTLHVYKRNPYGLVGGWAGWSHSGGADLLGVGAEGQAYLNSATIYGSAGYGRVSDTVDQNLWAARLEGRYYVTENFLIGAQVGLVRASARNGTTTARSTVRTAGLGFEYQYGELPFSIQGTYAHADASNSSAESDTLRLGLRWNFDGGTLFERDRTGATLNNVTDLFLSN